MRPIEELIDFIESTMQMSEVYQPVVILHLLNSGGSASLSEIAETVAQYKDESSDELVRRLRKFPRDVLTKHGIVSYDEATDRFALGFDLGDSVGVEKARTAATLKIEGWVGMSMDASELSQVFEQVLGVLANPKDMVADGATDEELDRTLFARLQEQLSDASALLGERVPSDYRLGTGAGIGTRADVPWVAVYPPGQETQEGYYLVYLFAADGSAVYLSLNQGTERIRGGTKVLRKRSLDLRRAAGLEDRDGLEIDLRSGNTRPQKYQAGNAYSIRYQRESVPVDDGLWNDLAQML